MDDDMGGFKYGGPLMGYQDGGNLIAKIGQYMGMKDTGVDVDDILWQIQQEISKKGGVNQIRHSDQALYNQIRKSGIDVSDLFRAKSIPTQRSLFSKALGGHGLGALLAFALVPEKLDGSGDDVLKEMRERVWRDNMDERYGIGWSPDPVETPRINPGRRIDLSRVMRAGR